MSGAYVKVVDFSIWRGLRWETTSDDRGRIEWAEWPGGKVSLVLEKDGFIAAENRYKPEGDKETRSSESHIEEK